MQRVIKTFFNIFCPLFTQGCPCGYYTDPKRRCRCNTTQIQKYLSRISGPLLDRIDIHIDVPSLKYKELSSLAPSESSSEIKKRVNKARGIQRQRFNNDGIYCNGQMRSRDIKQFCALNDEGKELLKMAIQELGISARAYDRILKVARTIADLAGSRDIEVDHLSESIQYRSLDRNLWV